MRNKNIIMAICGMIILSAPGVTCAAKVDEVASVTSSATISLNPQAMLDDFERAAAVNTWNCRTGTYTSASTASCLESYVNDSNAYSGYSLKLAYNVSASDTYAGYYSKLGSQSISAYTTLSFWVKGASGGEFFKVELKNTGTNADTNAASVYITDYLDGGVTTGWQYVTIPLYNFTNISDWASGLEFCITFENSQSVANGSATAGVVYIDNITFGNAAVNNVRIGKFGSRLGRCSLGGNIGDMPNAYATVPWARHAVTNEQYNSSPYSMLSEYDVTSGDQWAGQYMIFGGGATGWVAVPHNFSAFNFISFYVKARSPAENPLIMKIELSDSDSSKYYILGGITTSWQFVKIPFTSITSDGSAKGTVLDKTTIKQLSFVFEKWRIYYAWNMSASAAYAGAVYIDDIQFTKT